MGNQIQKNCKSCCSNEYFSNKKEVTLPEETTAGYTKVTPRLRNKGARSQVEMEEYDLPQTKRSEASHLEFRVHSTNFRDVNRMKSLQQMSNTGPLLTLKVLNSATLTKDTEIRINAQGVQGSLRKKLDGITYFGTKKKAKSAENDDEMEVVNDYIIKSKDPDLNEQHRGRHFQIEYSIDTNNYKIKDLGIGFGVFAKIDHPFVLIDNSLISMGTSFLIINMDEEENNSLLGTRSQTTRDFPFASTQNDDRKSLVKRKEGFIPDITVKIFGGPNYGEVYRFSPDTPIIRIGRMPECEVKMNDGLLSKYQGSIKYVPKFGWTLYDGWNEKTSTNGNWLYLNEDYDLYHGMHFKANHTLFEVTIEDRL